MSSCTVKFWPRTGGIDWRIERSMRFCQGVRQLFLLMMVPRCSFKHFWLLIKSLNARAEAAARASWVKTPVVLFCAPILISLMSVASFGM